MMKSPLMRLVGMGSWLITGLAALNVGLSARGFDLMSKIPAGLLQDTVIWVVALSGLVSLVLFVMSIMGCDSCDVC